MYFCPKQYYASAYISILTKTAKRLSCPDNLVDAISRADISEQQHYVDANLPDQPVISCYREYPSLSFEFGKDMTLATHEFLGYLIRSSVTIDQALTMWSKYIKTRTSLIDLLIDKSDPNYVLININFDGVAKKRIEFFFEAFVMSLCSILRQLSLARDIFAEFEVPYSKPDHFYLYQDYLGQHQIRFNAPAARIILTRRFLNSALNTHDPALLKLCESQCQDRIAKLPDHTSFGRSIITRLETLDSQFPSLPEMAKLFAVSERTFRRKLQQENLNYREIIEEIKNAKACELLTKTDMDIAEISDLLGYADLPGFYRAFKRWHNGITPSLYRTGNLIQTY